MDLYLKNLLDQKAEALKGSRSILETAEKEKRALSADEQVKYDDIFSEVENLSKTAEKHKRQLELEKEMMANEQRGADAAKAMSAGKETTAEDREMAAFRSFLLTGNAVRAVNDSTELRAKQADNNLEGGYLIAPEQFVMNLIKDIDNDVFIRGLATTYQINGAASLGAPSLDTDVSDPDWTTEIATRKEETDMRIGKRNLKPTLLTKRVKVSKQLLRQASAFESIVMDRLRYKFSTAQENNFLNGNGNLKPLGVMTASTQGISTNQDVSTGNSTTAIGADNLREVFYSLKSGYAARGTWVFSRKAVKQISQLKDGNGQYLWQEGIRAGDPATIQGRPVLVSEYMPDTFTTGQYVGIFGDFSYYWIADSLTMQMQALNELYAETGQIGYIGEMMLDGMPVLENAFARVKLA
jgi:HK97 family phage major capsid protein